MQSAVEYFLIGAAVLVLLLLLIAVVRALFIARRPGKTGSVPAVFEPETVGAHLTRMIACRTYEQPGVPPEDNAELARLRELLRELYPRLHETAPPELIGCGLVFHWKGTSQEAPVIYMAHYDVVPADPEGWSFDPFDAGMENGVVRGRGAIDTKITLCAVLEAAERLIGEGFVPLRDVYLCFGGDEETNGTGAQNIVDELERRGVRPEMVLDEGGAVVEKVFPGVGCRLAMVGVAEKGIAEVSLVCRSNGGHGSTPPRQTPVNILGRAMHIVSSKPFAMSLPRPTRMLLSAAARRASFPIRLVLGNLWLFAPVVKLIGAVSGGEMNAMMRTTCAFTMMSGSDAINVIPTQASVGADMRVLPGSTVEECVGRVRKLVRRLPVEVKVCGSVYEPSRCSPADGMGWDAICATVSELWQGAETVPYMMNGHSDSSVYTRICDRVYRFAPVFLSGEERAMIHGTDERIGADRAALAADFYYLLTKRMMG